MPVAVSASSSFIESSDSSVQSLGRSIPAEESERLKAIQFPVKDSVFGN